MATSSEFNAVITQCRELFVKKMKDYGSSWRIMRLPSLTDQIFIKAKRIREIQETGVQCVNEDINGEFIAIINYSIIALIQIELADDGDWGISESKAIELYDKYVQKAHDLMLDKTHDYGDAWRDMRQCSFCDIILQKLLRVKSIEDNNGITLISEGIDANYYDIINYAVFALIKKQ
ncbi:hypothetical protein FACS1894178_8780 [Bacteroidia bacterium]|nr:hypothetical protein FACS1894178_8780 [Bacteroidia bacterium]